MGTHGADDASEVAIATPGEASGSSTSSRIDWWLAADHCASKKRAERASLQPGHVGCLPCGPNRGGQLSREQLRDPEMTSRRADENQRGYNG